MKKLNFAVKQHNIVIFMCLYLFSVLLLNTVQAHGISGKDAHFLQENNGQAIGVFIYLGAKHMITGYDHLLYLCGVIFFLYKLREVALFVSLFALGHSITLLSGVLIGLKINPYIIDAIIGLSVAYKALENLDSLKSIVSKIPNPKLAVFIFGLVHGLGLATKIQDMTLSDDGLVTNMLSFNLGVEIGQMIALLGALVAINLWRTQGGFYKHARMFNYCLMFSGFMLASFQISGYFLSFALL